MLSVLVGLERLELLEAQATAVARQVVVGRGDAHAALVVRQDPGEREERDGARRVDARGVVPVPQLPLPQRDGGVLTKRVGHLLLRLMTLLQWRRLLLLYYVLLWKWRRIIVLLLEPRVDFDQLDIGDDLGSGCRRGHRSDVSGGGSHVVIAIRLR